MSDAVAITIPVVTVYEMTVPRWMTTFIRPLFAIPTHMTPPERLALMDNALRLPQGFTVVEIGSYVGASTAFLALAASRREGTIHAIDTWENDAMGYEGNRDTYADFCANTAPFEHFITPHRGKSVDVARAIGTIACDMLFIDGDHAQHAVVADLHHWLPSLKPGGLLAMHDIDAPSVRAAFEEVLGPDRCTETPQLVDRLLLARPIEAALKA